MKYNIGDKVRIKKDLFRNRYVVDLAGKIVTIKERYLSSYAPHWITQECYIVEEDKEHEYTENMLEDVLGEKYERN